MHAFRRSLKVQNQVLSCVFSLESIIYKFKVKSIIYKFYILCCILLNFFFREKSFDLPNFNAMVLFRMYSENSVINIWNLLLNGHAMQLAQRLSGGILKL